MKLAIIGTAGRKEDAKKLTLPVWNDMKRIIARFVKDHGIKHVISGGAAGADALAVGLYLAGLVDHLDLALPAPFESINCAFHDSGGDEAWDNPGATCNWFHERFSITMGINSLKQLDAAIAKGAHVIVEPGFNARNTVVAQADALIAFTFGNGAIVKRGGTWNTVKKYLDNGGKRAYHVDLHDMHLYNNALLS